MSCLSRVDALTACRRSYVVGSSKPSGLQTSRWVCLFLHYFTVRTRSVLYSMFHPSLSQPTNVHVQYQVRIASLLTACTILPRCKPFEFDGTRKTRDHSSTLCLRVLPLFPLARLCKNRFSRCSSESPVPASMHLLSRRSHRPVR